MNGSKVYFADMHTTQNENLPQKLRRLVDRAGMDKIDFHNKYVAIKIHFGEPGNLAFLRPNYAKVLVDYIEERGGKAFLTDCNTLYVGGRKNALDHLDTAYENGFSPFSTGCHVLIADGLKGTDEAIVDVDGDYVKHAKIGHALADADIVISLTHFKGHENTGFGGALKNLGMGGGSRAGKMEMHSAGKPYVDQELCVGCGACTRICAHGAAIVENGKARIDQDRCVGCGRCIGICPMDATQPASDEAFDILNKKIVEYALAVVKDKPHFHVSIAVDISPNCDCHSENDIPIVPNIGMFASFDPVAIDLACADMVNAMPELAGSDLAKSDHTCGDHFMDVHPETDWRVYIEHGKKLGLGEDAYELVKI